MLRLDTCPTRRVRKRYCYRRKTLKIERSNELVVGNCGNKFVLSLYESYLPVPFTLFVNDVTEKPQLN